MKIFKSWTFRWWEVSLLKLCLISLGILIGVYAHAYVSKIMWLWWMIFGITAAYFIGKFAREGDGTHN